MYTQRDKSEAVSEMAQEAQVSLPDDHEHQLNAESESLMQKSQSIEGEFSSAECKECPRWASLDSDIAASEELSSCDLQASNTVFNTTFAIEVDPLDSDKSPPDVLDLKTTFVLSEPTGIKSNANETFILQKTKDNCISVPNAYSCMRSSAKALSPLSSCNDNEEEYNSGQGSDEKGAYMKGKGFEIADDDLDSSSFIRLQGNGGISANAKYCTSTPVASGVANSIKRDDLNIELTLKGVQHIPTPTKCEFEQYIPNSGRMSQICTVNRTVTKPIAQNRTNETFLNSDTKVIMNSFVMLPLDDDGHEHDKHNQTFTRPISEIANSATASFGGNLSFCGRPARYGDCNTLKPRALSSMRNGGSFMLQHTSNERNSLYVNENVSSHTDMFGDDAIVSFFVTELPSVLVGECDDFLRSEFHRQSILSLSAAQTPDVTSPQNIRIAVKSGDSSPDLITDESFPSLLGHRCLSFDGSSVSVNGLDSAALRQHLFVPCIPNVTAGEDIQQPICASKYY